MRKTILGVAGVSAALALGLAGCSSTTPLVEDSAGESAQSNAVSNTEVTDLEGKTIGITVADLTNQYYVSVTDGMKDACEELGCSVEIHDGKQDTLSQISAIENFVTKGTDVIIVAANADNTLDSAAKQAMDAGVPVIALAQQTDGVNAFVRLSEEEAGATSGKVAADWINENLSDPSEAKVLIVGDKTVSNKAIREEGIKKGLEENAPGVVIVAEAPANSTESAISATENALTANPGINVVVGDNDDTALGAYEAMVAAGKVTGKAAVIGFDATPEAIKKILEKGLFVGTVSVDAYKQGGLLVDTALEVLQNGTVGDIYVPFDPVTIENAGDYQN
ncbi:sugar ABC transporter substrate-binding protein [Actinomycetaceae bacterium MB13-C1-2]|nr:sugar ABC transporter substrate-binding protein [Actinomycetaceae bacterium MB13-C1-2]